jgi:hypothetical protein
MRALQKTAISACDIDYAEQIDDVISSLHKNAFDTAWNKLKADFGDAVRSLLALYEQNMRQVNETEESKLLTFKRQINTDFLKLQARHREYLTDLQKEFASLRLRESQRTVRESDELVKQSKYAASIHNYEQAKMLQSLAQTAAQNELERRFERIETEMRIQVVRTIAEQQKEIENLVERLERGITTIKTAADNDRALEFDMKDVKFIGELTKYTKDLVAIAGQHIPVPPYQRELEDLLREIIESAGLAVPAKLKRNAKTATKQSSMSPRSGTKW